MGRLVVISNRVPQPGRAKGSEGGLAVVMRKVIQTQGGLWFGWNGNTEQNANPELTFQTDNRVTYATFSLQEKAYSDYYKGYANSILWPLFHQRPDLVDYRSDYWQGYIAVNQTFARLLQPLLRADDILWIQDYHLIPLGLLLRHAKVNNPLGFFLHTPFPPHELLRTLPDIRYLLKALMAYDLVGLQTPADRRCCIENIACTLRGKPQGQTVQVDHNRVQIKVYPVGIDIESTPSLITQGQQTRDYARLRQGLSPYKLIMGVDRLDYTKGLIHRCLAYKILLRKHPAFLRNTAYLQIAPYSRDDIAAYQHHANVVDHTVRQLNDTYAESDWLPLHYYYRDFMRSTLFALYRLADVGFVMPLRDGMNLVGKEYLVAQDPEDPGSLILSHQAGAAVELDAAIKVNPNDIEGVSNQLARALTMPVDERKDRWQKNMAVLTKNDLMAWQSGFLRDLHGAHHTRCIFTTQVV